ncbi:MAG: OmpA family protein [Verrucomicrobiaceae bacterium]|nr:OmpA family protein [Verrucomicrobiaceae bacterium]
MNKPTALIFFGIIAIASVLSFLTLTKCGKDPSETPLTSLPSDAPAGATESQPGETPEPESKPTAETTESAPAATTAPPEKKADAPAATGIFASPDAAMTALAAKIGEKNFEAFLAATGPKAVAGGIRAEVKAIIENPDLKLDASKPFTEISKSAEGGRWSLNFVPATSATTTPRQIYADLAPTKEGGFDIAKISLPVELTLTDAADDKTTDPAKPDKKAVVMTPEQQSDALTVAHAFAKAVIQRDFNTARALADAAVTDERVAALMIAVEEGEFTLREERPLVVTLSRDDITWVLTRVDSDEADSEFALELGQVGSAWKVNGLTFSKVLSALSEKAGGGNIAYSPIVEDPAGGDSLVLYFEFDEAGLTPRTSRQLEIVADILKQGSERVVRINGHADALGSDDYNIALSDQRAESIRRTLLGMGVKPAQVITEAFGATKPRKPNFLPDGSDNPGGRSQNRRAEVLLDF